jgi:ribosomal protein S18 acetylase RimI-like enzyme
LATIRAASVADVPAIEDIVRAAYCVYLPRMGGKPPGPMLDDYTARVRAGSVSVVEDGRAILGVLVLIPELDCLLLDNVAVAPEAQGRGLGRHLVEHAEAEARRLGLGCLRLYTNVAMVENVALYAALGFEETHRAEQAGYGRVFMRKRLGDER